MVADKKIIVFGLDCAPPQLVFEKWPSKLTNISSLMRKGIYGPLKSCIPPLTVPAWSCMMSGKNPGKLGCYGYRNRTDYTYNSLRFATSQAIKENRLWDILSRNDKKVLLVGVPQTYPPAPVNGHMVAGFLTPDTSCQYTYPEELKNEISGRIGEYIFDIDDFRTENKERIIKQVYEMTEKRFRLFKYLLSAKQWNFAMIVEIGVDRLHHAFWKFMDTQHPKHEPGNPYENVILDYYMFIDGKIGEILSMIDDSTAVFIVSDHGAKAMKGGFCINEWLINENYLAIKEKPDGIVPLNKTEIDWKNTVAWGEGGHCSRLYLNVKGREPQGIIPPEDYESVRSELKKKLEATEDESGINIGTRVFRPEDVYTETNGIPPDLIIYLGDLEWRSIGSVGFNKYHTFENDLGPDDANHSEYGICIMYDPDSYFEGTSAAKDEFSIYDIAPTVLEILGVPVPEDMEGKAI